MLKNYEYHRMLLRLIRENECKYLRREYVLADNNTVMTEPDY